MKTSIIVAVAIMASCPAYALGHPAHTLEIDLSIYGTPLVPRYSQLTAFVPLIDFGDGGFLSLLSLRTWYLTKSPYLNPLPFAEFGALIMMHVGTSPRGSLVLGGGTAAEFWDASISVPLVLTIGGCFRPHSRLRVSPEIDVLIWEDGVGGEVTMGATWFTGEHFHVAVEPGFTVYSSSSLYFGPKVGLSIGYDR